MSEAGRAHSAQSLLLATAFLAVLFVSIATWVFLGSGKPSPAAGESSDRGAESLSAQDAAVGRNEGVDAGRAAVSREESPADEIGAASDDSTLAHEARPPIEFEFHGVVSHEDHPLPGVRVELSQLQGRQSMGTLATVHTQDDGTYRTTVRLTPRSASDKVWTRVEAWLPDFQPYTNRRSVRKNAPELEENIELDPGGRLHGRVVDSQGRPVQSADAVLLQSGVEVDSDSTHEDGTYQLYVEHSGSFVLSARASEHGSAGPLPVEVRTDRINEAPDMVLRGEGVLEGILVDSFGDPIARHSLLALAESWVIAGGGSLVPYQRETPWDEGAIAEHEANGLVHAWANTDDEGRFRFAGLAQGRFGIVSRHAGQREVWMVTTGDTNLRLSRDFHLLEVRAFDESSGESLQCDVRVESADGEQSGAVASGRRCSLPVVAGAAYRLELEANDGSRRRGRRRATAERQVVIDGSQRVHREEFRLNLQTMGGLWIEWVTERPRGQVRVDFGDVHGPRYCGADPSEPSRFDLPVGTYTLRISPTNSGLVDWMLDREQPLLVDSDFPSSVPVVVVQQPERHVEIPLDASVTTEVVVQPAGTAVLYLDTAAADGQTPVSVASSEVVAVDGAVRTDALRKLRWQEHWPGAGSANRSLHWIQWGLPAGGHVLRVRATDARELEIPFTVTVGRLTVLHATWPDRE